MPQIVIKAANINIVSKFIKLLTNTKKCVWLIINMTWREKVM